MPTRRVHRAMGQERSIVCSNKLSGIILSFCFCSMAFGYDYKCPGSIQTNQSLTEPLGEGWDSFDDKMNGQKNFNSIQVYDGHPSEGASLIPDNENSKKDPYWTNQTVKGLWFACFYNQTSVRIVKNIPKEVKRCTLKYQPKQRKVNKVVDKLVCE